MAKPRYNQRVDGTHPTKHDAHAFYSDHESARGDVPASDLDAFFRREAGLPVEDDASLVRDRPSRTFANNTVPISAVYEHAEVGAVDLDKHDAMAGRLSGRRAVLDYIRAGNATVTVVSRRTATRFTFKFQRPKDWEPGPQRPVAPVFCKVMTGADNEGDFTFVGTMWPENGMFPDGAQVYRHSPKSRISLGATSVKALVWLVRTALHPDAKDALERCEVWHEGRCGRCGRKLTVPASIESGFGPECAGRM